MTDAIDTSTEAVEALVKDALKFCNLAAGEGFILFGVSPEDFLFAYSKATGFEDWDNIGQHIIASIHAERDQLRDELDAAIRSASDIAAEARAGAIEAAARNVEAAVSNGVFIGKLTDHVRALHDTDTLAAIERIKEQAMEEERERCATIAEDFGCCHVPAEIAKAITEPGGGDQPHTTD